MLYIFVWYIYFIIDIMVA